MALSDYMFGKKKPTGYIPEGGVCTKKEIRRLYLSGAFPLYVDETVSALLAALKDSNGAILDMMTDRQLDAKPTRLNGLSVRQAFGLWTALIAAVEKGA